MSTSPAPRIDFVIYRSDGTHCRIHPGNKQSNDARLIFSSRATEQTRATDRWASLPEVPFTGASAAAVPQIDRIGKEEAYQILAQIARGPLPTTADALFKWWLFIPNLGANTADVIGDGLVEAELTETWVYGVELRFTRCDATEVRVQIHRPPRSRCFTRVQA